MPTAAPACCAALEDGCISDVAIDAAATSPLVVNWVDYECPPPASPAFRHYGSEWDWLDFFWGLWAAAANAYSVAEIEAVWSATTERAWFCCHLDASDDPDDCLPSSDGVCVVGHYNTPIKVGKLWEADPTFDVDVGILDRVEVVYGLNTPKYNVFADRGGVSKVTY